MYTTTFHNWTKEQEKEFFNYYFNVNYNIYLDTAIVGKIDGRIGERTIAFRADMDGLSTDEGVKHLRS